MSLTKGLKKGLLVARLQATAISCLVTLLAIASSVCIVSTERAEAIILNCVVCSHPPLKANPNSGPPLCVKDIFIIYANIDVVDRLAALKRCKLIFRQHSCKRTVHFKPASMGKSPKSLFAFGGSIIEVAGCRIFGLTMKLPSDNALLGRRLPDIRDVEYKRWWASVTGNFEARLNNRNISPKLSVRGISCDRDRVFGGCNSASGQTKGVQQAQNTKERKDNLPLRESDYFFRRICNGLLRYEVQLLMLLSFCFILLAGYVIPAAAEGKGVPTQLSLTIIAVHCFCGSLILSFWAVLGEGPLSFFWALPGMLSYVF
jgi:hypothetical protein